MIWLQPLAWVGLLGIAVPIAIHLLARAQSRRVLFPSLRFLPVRPVAALRRRVLSEWVLLAIRALVVVAAVAALAGPVFVSSARRDSWNRRVARAIVTIGPARDEVRALAADEARTAMASAEFSAPGAADALIEAVRWLDRQPPASREIVVIGDVREGTIADRDFDVVPGFVGVRLLPVAEEDGAVSNVTRRSVAADGSGRTITYDVQASAGVRETRVRYAPAAQATAPSVRIVAAPSQSAHADALLRAVLQDGLFVDAPEPRDIVIAFRGADVAALSELAVAPPGWMRRVLEQHAAVRGGVSGGTLVLRADVEVTDDRAVAMVADILRAALTAAGDLSVHEPRRVSPATLARWSRPAGPSPPEALPADEGDRRWIWLVVLVLLGAETWVRRARHAEVAP